MPKYGKKPVVIEAMQWDGSRDSIESICYWVNGGDDKYDDPTISYAYSGVDDVHEGSVLIWTLEGDHTVSPGDFIIKDGVGEFYPCKPMKGHHKMKTNIPLPATAASVGVWMGNEAYEVFWEKIFDLDAEYELPLTNNEPRTEGGRKISHIGDFGSDVLAIFAKVLNVQAGLEKSDYFDD